MHGCCKKGYILGLSKPTDFIWIGSDSDAVRIQLVTRLEIWFVDFDPVCLGCIN
ncbi:hypothetical protein MANES_05G054150v8 [Manihot esculenta]|uniref:Uncharacterized protein n=1 Tax=Manihot esculenta TaxID=3983 RepID=A0ACB7HLW7_MANES|nr:hypothetical protein MANES_05G054150v8 [Manihot esculenta]